MQTLTSGSFTSRERAEQAMTALVAAGFSPDSISLLADEHRPDGAFAIERPHPRGHRIAALGAGLGAAFGALAGGVAGASALGGPELPILAAGPLVVAISGFAAGALVGGFGGAFVHRGIPRSVATFDEGEGDDIVAGVFVQDDRALLARSVLDTCGAEAITAT